MARSFYAHARDLVIVNLLLGKLISTFHVVSRAYTCTGYDAAQTSAVYEVPEPFGIALLDGKASCPAPGATAELLAHRPRSSLLSREVCVL